MVVSGGEKRTEMSDYSLPAMEKVQKALAKDLVETFEKGDLAAVYQRVHGIVPKLYPAHEVLRSSDLDKVTELLADCFLLLGKR